jgi:hypothetical protein
MSTLYECPGCHQLHDEPLDPAYQLAARCFDCALEIEFFERRGAGREFRRAA